MRLGAPVKGTPHGMFDSDNVDAVGSETSEEEEQPVATLAKRKRQHGNTDTDAVEGEATLTVVPRKRQRRLETKTTSGDDDEAPKKHSKRKGALRQDTPEEDELRTPPRSTRRKLTRRRSPTVEEDDEDEELVAPRRGKPRRRKSTSDEEAEDIEEQTTPPRSTRRRVRRRIASESDEDAMDNDGVADEKDDGEEQGDLKEDLAFLRSSPLPDRGRLRSTHEKPKTERQKALEALKRRRAGTNEPSSSATPGRTKKIVIDTESESELEIIKEEPESDAQSLDDDETEDDAEEPDSEREANRLDMFQEDVDDEGFIDDDVEAVIGQPAADLDELRLTLSLSRAKPRELFKHAVEWMVMKKIHPGFDSTRNIYTFTFRKLDDEVKGLAGSKFTSSAWGPDFTRAIKARPDLLFTELTSGMREVMSPHCAACNRRSHPASWELMLSGQPYHEDTLEPVEQNSDSSDSDSDDSDISADSETQLNGEKPTYNEKGEQLVPESHRFFLGSTCKANAQVSHTLYHWRYHLYSWVKDYLVRQGHLTAEKLVWRDRRSDRKREKEAQKIVDAMETDGEIQKLYKLYKDQVKFALEAKNEYKHGWGRRG